MAAFRTNLTDGPYTIYDKLPVVNQGAIIENKRLGHVLRVVQELQKKRDTRKGLGRPAHTNTGAPPTKPIRAPGTVSMRGLSLKDLAEAISTVPMTVALKAKLSAGSRPNKMAAAV